MARGQKTKQKELTPEERLQSALVPEEEWPYELPEGWKWVRLAGTAETIKDKTDVFDDPNVRYVGLENIENSKGIVSFQSVQTVKSTKSVFKEGDILYGKLRPYLNKHGVADFGGVCSTDIMVLRPYGFVDGRYINYYLSMPSFIQYAVSESKGINLPRVSPSTIENAVIPLPEIGIQKKIVNFIENEFQRLDEAKDQIQSVLDSSEERKQSILHRAFTGKLTEEWRKNNELVYQKSNYYEKLREEVSSIKKKKIKKINNPFSAEIRAYIPKKWKMCELDAVSRQITDGEHSTPRRVDAYIGYYLLSARNVRDDSIQLDDVDYIDAEEYGRITARCNPGRGDVLISCSGSVGRVCVIEDDNKYCMVRSAAMISPVMCNPRFIMYMLQSPELQKEIKELSKQTAQANLFLGAIAALLIPLPIIEEQDEVVRILDSYFLKDNQIVGINEQINDQIDVAKKSILSKAFRGELHL